MVRPGGNSRPLRHSSLDANASASTENFTRSQQIRATERVLPVVKRAALLSTSLRVCHIGVTRRTKAR
jgi:hypothetical protein